VNVLLVFDEYIRISAQAFLASHSALTFHFKCFKLIVRASSCCGDPNALASCVA